jgi:hypothetical protein
LGEIVAFIDWGESERQKAGDGFQQRIRKPEYAAMHDFYQLRTIERKSKGRLPIWTIQCSGITQVAQAAQVS